MFVKFGPQGCVSGGGGGVTRQSFTYTMYMAVILLQIHVVVVNPGTHLVNKSRVPVLN